MKNISKINEKITNNDCYMLLEIGRYYKIKDSIKAKCTNRKVKYCGIETYKGREYHSFFDEFSRLFHWIDADKVELCC